MTTHTKGPWKFGHMGDGERWWIGVDYDRPSVAHVDRHDWPEAVVAANLRVIAAAPALLEACKAAFHALKMDAPHRTEIDDLNAAIVKAEGK
jgi:hypothetical protein